MVSDAIEDLLKVPKQKLTILTIIHCKTLKNLIINQGQDIETKKQGINNLHVICPQ